MRTLIVKLSSLGDVLHALPTVHALHDHLGGGLDWVVQEEYAALVETFTDVDQIFSVARHRGWRGLGPVLRDLRRARYDWVIDLQGLQKSALIARLAGGRRCIGPSYQREGARLWYHAVAGPRDRSRHAVVQAMDVLPQVGAPRPQAPCFPMQLPAFPLELSRPRIGIAPVSRWPSKNWPLSRFAELAARLQRELGAGIVVLGGAADAPAARVIADACGAPVSVHCGTLDLPRLGGVLAGLDVLVANDSGPVHLAAAAGCPCVVFYGPTDPARTGPWGSQHRLLTTSQPCFRCYRQRCPFGDDRCWDGIDAAQAFNAVQALLLSQRPPHGRGQALGEGSHAERVGPLDHDAANGFGAGVAQQDPPVVAQR